MERRVADRLMELLQGARVDPKDWMHFADQLREFTRLVEQFAGQLGQVDAVLALAPSAFAKKGGMPVGVARLMID